MSKAPSSDSHDSGRRRQPARGRVDPLLWLMVPLAYGVVAWSFWGHHVVAENTQQFLEVTGIALTGTLGLLLALYVRHRNLQVERAYSTHLEELSQRLRSLAYRDSLTDLYNYRFFQEQLEHEIERATRYKRPVSVILIDLDRFKEVNDTHGHLIGDKLLAFVGQVISAQVRGADIAARYGGDEFAIILTDTPRAAAEATAEKLANAIAADHMHSGLLSTGPPVSISCGVASCPDEARSVTALLQLADDRLYVAKGQRFPERSAAG